MAINFPNDPAVNATITVDANTWVWNGVTWAVQPIVSPSFTDVNATGTITGNNISASYVEASGVGSKIRFYFADTSAFPSAAIWEGSIAYAGNTDKIYLSDGTAWQELARTTSGINTTASSSFSDVAITGGSINGTPIGASTPAAAAFTSASVSAQPTLADQLTNKRYVDQQFYLAIALSG
jgi:hypothetical protein